MKRLAILGASGHGKVVADAAESAGWSDIVFFDDKWPELTLNGRWPVIGDSASLLSEHSAFDGVVVAIGLNCIRLNKLGLLLSCGARLVSVVHPGATVSSYAVVGLGTVIMAGAVVNVDSRLGMGCIVNTCASVDHDCFLADGVHICPGAHLAGGVTVGQCSWVGIGASVRQYIRIGAGVVVGAGAAVVNEVSDQCTVAGIPARALNQS
ncbi:acetyltransferase [Desulfoluna spongiiphila]|uniref:acetyltransferase n=1 Tax=Desulfoluna spongiiphila TaxID=419481 RepID=UPI001254A761|nr:acetyltransferase [Desulfoluna spongiiphila]VVS94878.1 sialic acid o-acyltransferase neud-like [Desulfoluna spongiiphila]